MDAYDNGVGIGRGMFLCVACLVLYSLQFKWQFFANIGANGTPIFGAVGVPVRSMPYAFTTFAAPRLAAVTNLLMISDIAIHRSLASYCMPRTNKISRP